MTQLTEDQMALLIYIETRVVDHGGNIAGNKRPGDAENLKALIQNRYIMPKGNGPTYYRLTIKGWALVHNLRMWLGSKDGNTYGNYPYEVDENGEIGY